MTKFLFHDIVFQEVPNEISLCIKISQCPFRCEGCQSDILQKDVGDILNKHSISKIINQYLGGITCVLFMGGDLYPEDIFKLSKFVRDTFGLKTAWYSGSDKIDVEDLVEIFDFVKLGSYQKGKGGLASKKTNQRFYTIYRGVVSDKTSDFFKN